MEQAPSSNTTGLVWIRSPALVRHQESYLEWVVVGGRCEGKGIGQEVLNVPSAWLGDQYTANWEPVPLQAGGVRAVYEVKSLSGLLLNLLVTVRMLSG